MSPTPPADGVQRQYDAEGLAVFPDRGPAVPTEDLEGAKQAAARYLDEYYKALQTRLDAYLWNNATAGCVYCQTAIGNIEDIRERGIRLGTDAEWTVESTSADLANDEVDYARVVLAVEDPEISLVDDQGVVQVHQSSEGTSNLLVAVRRTEKLWAIVGIEVISAEEAAELNQQWSP